MREEPVVGSNSKQYGRNYASIVILMTKKLCCFYNGGAVILNNLQIVKNFNMEFKKNLYYTYDTLNV